jgi:DNA-binding NtrC family response regulator
MNKNGPIIVIDDDQDDQELMKEIFSLISLRIEVIFFSSGEDALDYLNKESSNPFLVLSDIKLPGIDGITLRKKLLDTETRYGKNVPFIFLTTGTYRKAVLDAYAVSVLGFFIKPLHLSDLQSLVYKIIDYWRQSVDS